MKSGNFIFSENYFYGFIIVLSLLLMTVIIPMEVQGGNPRIFPYLYSLALLFTATITLIKNRVTKQSKNHVFDKKVLRYVGIALLLYFSYTVLIQYIGYFTMSILFIAVLLRYLGEGWKIITVLCILIPGSIYFLFTKLLLLYFPEGILF